MNASAGGARKGTHERDGLRAQSSSLKAIDARLEQEEQPQAQRPTLHGQRDRVFVSGPHPKRSDGGEWCTGHRACASWRSAEALIESHGGHVPAVLGPVAEPRCVWQVVAKTVGGAPHTDCRSVGGWECCAARTRAIH